MNKKFYEAPETELTEIRFEENFLDSFGSGSGTASAQTMNSETWNSWDE